MANTIRFIKNVNNGGAVNNLQLLFQFIVGSNKIEKHDNKKAYKKGDFVYKFDEAEGEYQIFMAITDIKPEVRLLSTEYWKRISIKDLLSEGDLTLGKAEDIVKISSEQPTQPNNNIWLKPLKYKSFGYEGVDKEDVTLIFDCEHIVGQDDEPDDPDIRLWFDYEFDNEGNLITNSSNDEEKVNDDGLEILLDDFSDF